MASFEALIRLAEVKSRTARSRTAIYRDIAAGSFPAPLQIGARAVAWRESEVEAWIASRAAGVRTAVSVAAVRARTRKTDTPTDRAPATAINRRSAPRRPRSRKKAPVT
jgi:prophage regulatory protein